MILYMFYMHLLSQGIDCVFSTSNACIITYDGDRGHNCCTVDIDDGMITVSVLGDHHERFDLADPHCIEMLCECIREKHANHTGY